MGPGVLRIKFHNLKEELLLILSVARNPLDKREVEQSLGILRFFEKEVLKHCLRLVNFAGNHKKVCVQRPAL